jgi:hypothetical protein
MIASLSFVGTSAMHYLQAAEPNTGTMTSDQLSQQIALEAIRHNPANSPFGILVPISVFAMIVAIVWLGMRQKQTRLRIRAEFHKQLLDKFNSGREFAEFLESKGSQRFLEELRSQGTDSKERPLRFGIVLTMLGLALLGLSWMKKDLLIPGVLILALGSGYLISSFVSYRLSKKWTLTKEVGSGNAEVS